MPRYASTFRPPWWLRNCHLQTCWPTFAPRRLYRPAHPERLELPDGDFLDLVWTRRPHRSSRRPIVALLHGLEGSAHSPYARGMLSALHRCGWSGVLMHFRGCSGEPNRLPRCYHSGETGDPGFLFQWLQRNFPRAPLAAVGYSLGGNVLLKYLGERAGDTPLRAVAAVCPPLRLASCAERLEQGLSRIYQEYLLRRLKGNLLRKMRQIGFDGQLHLRPRQVIALDTFRRYDDAVTAPLHGFRDADDYYTRCSALPRLCHIATPSLILHAADDPFMGPDVIPGEGNLAPTVHYELSRHGGHVGFVGNGGGGKLEYWLERRIPEFLHEHLI